VHAGVGIEEDLSDRQLLMQNCQKRPSIDAKKTYTPVDAGVGIEEDLSDRQLHRVLHHQASHGTT